MNENEKAAAEAAITLARLDSVGKALLAAYDDAGRLRCPVCHYPSFEVNRVYRHIVFECQTPIQHDCEEGGPFCVAPCGFRYIVDPTTISNLPNFFAEAAKPGRPKKRSRSRRNDDSC